MAKTIVCLVLLACNLVATLAAEPATNTASRTLIIEASAMPLKAGKATLTVSPLMRTNGVYVGDFKVAVFPYFFKSDHGRLAINVSDEALATVNQGKPVTITGTSTSAKNGVIRKLEISVMPQDRNHGTTSLWFMAGGQKMIFTPVYEFTNNLLTTACASKPPPSARLP